MVGQHPSYGHNNTPTSVDYYSFCCSFTDMAEELGLGDPLFDPPEAKLEYARITPPNALYFFLSSGRPEIIRVNAVVCVLYIH